MTECDFAPKDKVTDGVFDGEVTEVKKLPSGEWVVHVRWLTAARENWTKAKDLRKR